MLFPTRFKTEGIPETIIDALFSGVPVIATKWENAVDIINDHETGYLVDMYDTKQFQKKLMECLNTEKVISLKKNILLKANDYTSSNAIKDLTKFSLIISIAFNANGSEKFDFKDAVYASIA